MAKPRDIDVNSTMLSMANTTDTRKLAHQLLNSPVPGAPLTSLQFRQLLNSPLGSMLKNTLFASIMYCYLLTKVRERQIELILEKLGLKKEMRHRFLELLKRYEAAAHKARMHELEEEYELEEKARHEVVEKLKIDLSALTTQLSGLTLELDAIHLQQKAITDTLVLEHQHHRAMVQNIALDHNIVMSDEQVALVLPQAHKKFTRATTPQEQIRAMAMLRENQDDSLNDFFKLQKFLGQDTLKTTLAGFENRAQNLTNDFSKKNHELTQKKLEQLELEQQIGLIKELVAKISQLPMPKPGINQDALLELANQRHSPKK